MIQVLFFASLREALGKSTLAVPWEEGATVSHLKGRLAEVCPGWAELSAETTVLCAVNQAMAADHWLLQDGDEVAFFPRVTGG